MMFWYHKILTLLIEAGIRHISIRH